MSLQFSDTTTGKGLVQQYESELGFEDAFVSSDTELLKKFTVEANIALDDYFDIALPASGTWQLDDTNNESDMPIIKAELTSGKRTYAFVTDEQGNLILDVYRVFVKDKNGVYIEVLPKDSQSSKGVQSFTDGRDTTGIPSYYDKTGNNIVFDVVPDYTATDGVKVYINREGSYFTTSDTTKKPGVPGLYHKYFYLKPAMNYARINGIDSHNRLQEQVEKLELAIAEYHGQRERDVEQVLQESPIQFI